ncbi:MAG: hypothetical protein HKP61_06250, partial [Dactylosporangium sp.]|nr:hypothetical protein [Dactylosporangium sp.]NNJ60548.1 hypothetical protein [Dactylosporangium sp.]
GRGHPPSGRRTRRASPLLAVLIPLIVVLLGVVGFLGARVGAEILGDRGTPTTAAATTPSAKQTTARAISPPSVSAPSLTPPTATPPTLGFPAAMAGTWSGQMVQSNGTRWPMRVTIQAGADRAKVSYPSAGCTGVWTMLAHVEELVVAHEYISEGSCTVRGEMGLVLDDRDALIVEYKPEKAEYTATATLIRSASTPET